ncbi:hypothetical protein T440DRAFT_474680 [Plenodomus tracheiphilus IPT5]|uniref:Uncharacterized protein n=1 Tax=Plenodomus tracheiphilus IPT5 TaxID=1408161 RepID=A0A6A7BMA8_9PLEO|nr:hypothetical protein T440DRAFT_474680 [Plenodomus tracheiphilus IPT5]
MFAPLHAIQDAKPPIRQCLPTPPPTSPFPSPPTPQIFSLTRTTQKMWSFYRKFKKQPTPTNPISTPPPPTQHPYPSPPSFTPHSSTQPPRTTRPYTLFFPDLQETLPYNPTTTTNQSNAFNSQRATGMNELQQLQFVEQLKYSIIDNAKLIFTPPMQQTIFKVIIVRRERHRVAAFAPGFGDEGMVFVALLVGVARDRDGDGSGNGGAEERGKIRVVEQSCGEECMADAVEGLWWGGLTC